MTYDFGIVGGGIVGITTAYKLSLGYPGRKIVLFEKEPGLATHQTGRNSGVVHSGIYYKPGSVKARTCRDGKAQLEVFCVENGVRWEACGKVIVALDAREEDALTNILDRGRANGVHCSLINQDQLRDREPHVAGHKAILVNETGIVDYVGFVAKVAQLLMDQGHEIHLSEAVCALEETRSGVKVRTNRGDYETRYLVNCAGLQCDKVAALAGIRPGVQIVPFRGEYYELTPEAHSLCRHLIYPVPDSAFPFLGVHFTRMVKGGVECGPNAVLAFGRQAYTNTSLNVPEFVETLAFRGFRKMAQKHWRMGMSEMWRSYSKSAFVKALQRLIPEIQPEHLHKAPAGIRAQAVKPDGSLVDDFEFAESARAVHVLNAPSPAATASLAIADEIVTRLTKHF